MKYTKLKEDLETQIKKLMENSEKQNFESTIFDQNTLNGKILLDVNKDKVQNTGDQTFGSFVIPGETTIKYGGGHYVLGTKDQIQKYVALLYLRELNSYYIENNTREYYIEEWRKSKKELRESNNILNIVPWCVSKTIFATSSDDKNDTKIRDLKLNHNLETADNIFLNRPLFELPKSNFYENISLDEMLDAVIIDKQLIDLSCKKVARLYQKNCPKGISRLRSTLSNIHNFAHSTYKAELRYDEDDEDLHPNPEIGGKRFYNLPKAHRASIFAKRYEGNYDFLQLRNLVIEKSNSFKELEHNVKEYIDKTNPPIFELLIEMGKMNDEILQPCHDFLNKIKDY